MKDNLSNQEQLIRKIESLRYRIEQLERSEAKHKDEESSLSKARVDLEELLVRRSVELAKTNVDLRDEIEERKRAQAETTALKKQMEFILGATKTGLDIIDSDYNMVYIDPEWQKVYGDPKGKKCYQYFMGRRKVCAACGVTKSLAIKKPVVTEETLVKEGNRPIQVTTIPFQNEKGDWLVAEVNVDITERKNAQVALERINECFLGFGTDSKENIKKIIETVGLIFEGACILYNKEEGSFLSTESGWDLPRDLKLKDRKEGHICYDVITRFNDDPFIVSDLDKTPYAKSDPNVSKYGLKTYIGCAIKKGDKAIGSLCIVYRENKTLDANQLRAFAILARALGVEEERRDVEEVLKKTKRD